jgi:voltage-gated potassium channel
MNPYSNKGEVPEGKLRAYLYRVIFEAETRAGKAFDIVLIASILFSVAIVMLDSVAAFRKAHSDLLTTLEWVFTILFTFEYLLRLVVIKRPGQYAFSFFGVVDVLAVLPTYVSLVLPGGHYLLAIRALRLLRIFRVLKLAKYLREANELLDALRASRRKIAVFMFTVLTIVVICGSFMYVIEGGENGFTSIPRSVYWAVVTLTTVGYGDISPHTEFGQTVAAIIMILGYGIIAIPTGIVTAELTNPGFARRSGQACTSCGNTHHPANAHFCHACGDQIEYIEEG